MINIKNDFKIIEEKEAIEKMGINYLAWRRNYIRQITDGDLYDFKEGKIYIQFPSGELKISKTKNVSKRLDQILYQLMSPHPKSYQDTWIRKIREGRGHYTIEEIKNLKIWVEK